MMPKYALSMDTADHSVGEQTTASCFSLLIAILLSLICPSASRLLQKALIPGDRLHMPILHVASPAQLSKHHAPPQSLLPPRCSLARAGWWLAVAF